MDRLQDYSLRTNLRGACTRAGRAALGLAQLAFILSWLILGWLSLSEARGFDLEIAERIRSRSEATTKHSEARQQVALARKKVDATRADLDAFLKDHFSGQQSAAAPPLPAELEDEHPATKKASPEVLRLESQLEELGAQREHLLQTLTDAHPEVIDVDGRIASVRKRLDEQRQSLSANARSGGTSARGAHTLESQEQRQAEAAEYERLYDAWREAERKLDAARTAESAAADELATLVAAKSDTNEQGSEPKPPTTQPHHDSISGEQNSKDDTFDQSQVPAKVVVDAPPAQRLIESSGTRSSSASQTMALAALAVALAVSALAAVRLARSGSDTYFSNSDEVAAALAVPVIGVVTASSSRTAVGRSLRSLRSGVSLVLQLALAISVFSAIAYGILYWDAIAHFFSDPIPAMRSLVGA